MAQSSVEKAYQSIKNLIISRKLLPGQHIIETSMADQLGMSRTPVREAIKLLERDGLVSIIPNCGSFLRVITLDDAIDAYELSAAIESMAGGICAERIKHGFISLRTPEVIDLKSSLAQLLRLESENNTEEWLIKEEEFHKKIVLLSRNKLLMQERNNNRALLNQVQYYILPQSIDIRTSNESHRKMVEYILNGDVDAVMKVCIEHRLRTRDLIKSIK